MEDTFVEALIHGFYIGNTAYLPRCCLIAAEYYNNNWHIKISILNSKRIALGYKYYACNSLE
jgi:hypothetical protein